MVISMIRLGLIILLTPSPFGVAFAQDRQAVMAGDSAERQDAGEASQDREHHPRTVILVAEQDDTGRLTEWWRESGQPRFGLVASIVKERLSEHGYEMIDHAGAADFLKRTDITVLFLKVELAKLIGTSLDAQIAIIGKAAIEDVRGRKSSSAANVQLKAYWLDTGQYIGAAYTRGVVNGNDPGARDKALKQAALEGADHLLERMSHFCMEHGSHRRL